MLISQVAKIAEGVAKQSLIDYTKIELLNPEEALILKKCIIQNVELYLSPYVNDLEDLSA